MTIYRVRVEYIKDDNNVIKEFFFNSRELAKEFKQKASKIFFHEVPEIFMDSIEVKDSI